MDGGRKRKWRDGRTEGEIKVRGWMDERGKDQEGRRDRQWEETLGREGQSPGYCSLLL